MRRVVVVGGGVARFGRREATYRDLISEAGKAVFDDVKNIKPSEIEGFLLGTAMPERFVFQTHVAPLAAECIGIQPQKLIARTELLCASGSTAIRLASAFIAANMADIVMVVGAEKMIIPDSDESPFHMLAAADREWDSIHGITAPPFFSIVAQEHMAKYGTTEEQLAMVSIKNRGYSSKNPNAHFQKPVTFEEVMASKLVVPPLKLLDCCAMSDGAAAIILASEDRARDLTDKPVYILGSGQTAVGNNSANLPGYADWPALRMAAENAYKMAGIKAEDVDVAEVHDCFTISEIIEYEELGFTEKGSGGLFIQEGLSKIGGKVAVNPRGGLLGNGHPLGATGVAQAVHIVKQLRGEAGTVQVKNAKIGLTHNLSGLANTHTIVIYGTKEVL